MGGRDYVGGISAINFGLISNCYNEATILGYCAGGICGFNKGEIEYCYNAGTIKGVMIGGICGENRSAWLTNCFNIGKSENVGVIGDKKYVPESLARNPIAYFGAPYNSGNAYLEDSTLTDKVKNYLDKGNQKQVTREMRENVSLLLYISVFYSWCSDERVKKCGDPYCGM